MITGRGSQYFLTKEYQIRRCKALLDRTGFTDEELEELDIRPTDGTGRTDPSKYYVNVRDATAGKTKAKKVDLRTHYKYGV